MIARAVDISVGSPGETKAGRVLILDSLRGIVALVVVLHHLWTLFYETLQAEIHADGLALLDWVQAQNHRAVMVFFVLSGFTIALTCQGKMPVGDFLTGDYLWRRLRRIVPLFYLSLVWTALLGSIAMAPPSAFSVTTLLGNMLFLQTSASASGHWFIPFGGNGPYWSLSYEMFYYLALPVLLALSGASDGWGGRQRLRMLLLGLAALVVGLALLRAAPNPFAHFITLWIVWIAGFIAFGLPAGPQSLALLAMAPACCWGAVLLLDAWGYSSATLRSAAEGTSLAFVFGFLGTWRAWTGQRWVNAAARIVNACFSRVGRGSYALYLLHYPLLLALHACLTRQPLTPLHGVAAGVGFVAFVVWFCPWVERASLAVMPIPRARQHEPS